MADGYHGLLAPWIGGAGSDPTSTPVGYRGMLAPWMGGAGSLASGSVPGYRGMLAFWAGGAANSGAAPITPPHRRPSGVFLFGQLGRRDPRY